MRKKFALPLAAYLCVSRRMRPDSAMSPGGWRAATWLRAAQNDRHCTAAVSVQTRGHFPFSLLPIDVFNLAAFPRCLQWLLSWAAEMKYGVWLLRRHRPEKLRLGRAFTSGTRPASWCGPRSGLSKGGPHPNWIGPQRDTFMGTHAPISSGCNPVTRMATMTQFLASAT